MKPKIIQFPKADGTHDYLRVHPDTANIGLFRSLSQQEEQQFRMAAGGLASCKADKIRVSPLWHPVFQDQLITTNHAELV